MNNLYYNTLKKLNDFDNSIFPNWEDFIQSFQTQNTSNLVYIKKNHTGRNDFNYSIDKEENVNMEFEVVGFSKEDVKISYDNNILEVIAKNKNKRKYFYQIEFPNLDPEKFEAYVENGLLKIKTNLLSKHKKKLIAIK